MRRIQSPLLAVPITALVVAMAGCSEADTDAAQGDASEAVESARDEAGSVLDRARAQVEEGVELTRDCARIAEGLADVDFDASREQVQQEVDELQTRVDDLSGDELRADADELLSRVREYAQSANAGEDATAALGDVRESAERIGDRCNVPVEELVPERG